MPNNAIAPTKKSLADYTELRRRVRETIAAGKERALSAVEREGVRTKWEVGKLIQEHILLNKDRADYGERIIRRLSADLGIGNTDLKYMREFARAYPIGQPAGQLSWSHYQALLSINEPEKREALAKASVKRKWDRDTLRHEVKKLKATKQITVSEAPREEPLVPWKGMLDTYRIITAKAGPWIGGTALDLGFANYHRPFAGKLAFRDKEIVSASPTGKLTRVKDATERDLFTYRTYLLQVTDADTLWVLIDLGFGFVTQQQLRLRGIDAPEITSRAGQEAKRFVERELKSVSSLVITSTKSDKYDRYLADIFYMPARNIKISAGSTRATGHGYETKTGEQFLNNRLLEAGLAERL